MKKTIGILMILTVLCLTACDSAEQNATNSNENTETTTETDTDTTTDANEDTNADASEEKDFEIDPAFCSLDALKEMFKEKGFLDYYQIYEESNNEAPKTDYNGEEVIMPADLTSAMIGKIGDSMTYQESNQNTYTLWDSDSIVSLYGEPYEYQGLFLLVTIYDNFEMPDGCNSLDDYFVSCNGENVEFKQVLSDNLLISCYTFTYGYVVDMFYLVPDSAAMVAFKYEIPFEDNEEEIARLEEFGLPIITDYYNK